MQDDVKTLRERIDRAIQRITDGHGAMRVPADMTDPDIVLDACRRHIDAEPARLAAAREEQREACAQFCEEEYYDVSHSECAFADSLEAIRATPLTATPLKDRIAAAVATAREEQREADVRSCPTCKGEGFTMRVRECPFCNDSTHDHECPTDEVKVYCACGAAHIRATPLTATPLADELERAWNTTAKHVDERDAALARTKELKTALHLEREAHGRALREALDPVVRAKMMEPPPPLLLAPDVAALVAERDSWKATAAMHEGLREETLKANLNLAAERDAAQERVRELEDIACALAFDTGVARELAARSSRDMYAKAWEREIGPPYRAKTHHIDAMVLTTRDRMDEIKHLKAQLAEAVGVLRALLREEWYTYEGNLEASGHASVDDLNAARAFLAKVKP